MTYRKFYFYTMLWCFIVSVLGGAGLAYAAFIDGTVFRVPMHFASDITRYRLEKTVYHPGDIVRAYVSFCKSYPIQARTTWTLVDGQLITFTPITGDAGKGCRTDALFTIATLPPYLTNEVAHFEGEADYQVNPLHTVRYYLRTEDFTITTNP